MKIGLIDVDGHNFPNLALMKISAYHKNLGDEVEWANSLFGVYDRIYKSKVFTFTQDDNNFYNAKEIIKGGTGYKDYKKILPYEIEHICPDYSIYPTFEHALGFVTRGCINHCPWCVVPQKEGTICKNADIEEFLDNRKSLILLDNNILAHSWGLEQLNKIKSLKLRLDCNQGLDARKVDNIAAKLLAKIKWIKFLRFAADNSYMIEIVKDAVSKIRSFGYTGEFMIYTLIDGNIHECYQRIISLLQFDPKLKCHAQPFIDFNGKRKTPQWQLDLARWTNNHWVNHKTDFFNYNPRKGFFCKNYFN